MKSRPLQYFGLVVLLLASLVIIFYPVGSKPELQAYQVPIAVDKPFTTLVKSKKTPGDAADAAFNVSFPGDNRLPGALVIDPGGKTGQIPDRATTRAEASDRAAQIVAALAPVFKGVHLAPSFATELANLPQKPLFVVGQYAVYPVKMHDGSPVPAVKLGLDLQGGVSLVLQVRRAQFTYSTTANFSGPSSRAEFLQRVRTALNNTDANLGLRDADVSFDSTNPSQINIRTQAKDKATFNLETAAISTALTGIKDLDLTVSGKPEFYVPDADASQTLGYSSNTDQQDVLSKTVEIIRSRVDKLGVSEPLIQAQGTDRIVVQLPGVNDPQKAVAVVGQTARMEIRLLPANIETAADPKDANNVLFSDQKGNPIPNSVVRRESELLVSGVDVKPTTRAEFNEMHEPIVTFELQGEGSQKFAQVTAEVAGKKRLIPIFLDDRCIEAPVVNDAISGRGEISGGFKSIDDARSLALLLNSGALPAPIDVVENRTVSASLGTDSLVKSLRAGFIGILAVALFMMVLYRIPGVLANFALVVYCIVNLAVFVLVGGTLTLPGIAGFILAIAMSLDTNILVFERLKEEMVLQPTYASALRAAFSRAWTAILDSHVTTLIAAVVLFNFGTGPIKGFALTLGIGVLLSLFSAISVTRLFMWSFAGYGETHRNLFAGKLPDAALMQAQHKIN